MVAQFLISLIYFDNTSIATVKLTFNQLRQVLCVYFTLNLNNLNNRRSIDVKLMLKYILKLLLFNTLKTV